MAALRVQRVMASASARSLGAQRCHRFSSLGGALTPSSVAAPSTFVPKGLGLASPLTRKPKSMSARPAFSRGIARAAIDVTQLRGAREAVKELIKSKYCNPILIRLGWHDSGTYKKDEPGEWPAQGGSTASIRFKPEIEHGANAGLTSALALLEPIKQQFPSVSYADLFQLASATAVEVAGGPKIPMKYGRVDATSGEQCTPDGRLPAADPPKPAEHLRNVFYRMGLNDQDIVALSGAHTLGRARLDRSGFGKEETKYTKDGPGNPGGQSWTVDWLKFDNSYFKDIKAKSDAELLVLPTDATLFEDPEFKKYAEKYAEDQSAFFKDYAKSHAKLSELGAKFDPPQGVYIDVLYADDNDDDEPSRKVSDAMKERLRKEYEGFGGSPDVPLRYNPFLAIMGGVAVFAILAKLSGAL